MTRAPEDARTRILRAALQVIGRQGMGGVSNRAVARAAGVSLGSLTYHFESQQQLLRSSLELFLDEETVRLRELTDQLAAASLEPEQAAAGLQAMLATETERRVAKLEMYLQATRDPALQEVTRRCLAAYDELAAAALSATGVSDADEVAPIMVAIIDGLQLRRLATGARDLDLVTPLRRVFDSLPRD